MVGQLRGEERGRDCTVDPNFVSTRFLLSEFLAENKNLQICGLVL